MFTSDRILSFLSSVLGSSCPLCGTSCRPHQFCTACQHELLDLSAVCRLCATPLEEQLICGRCLNERLHYEAIAVVGDFVGPWAHLIRALKYQQRLSLLPALSHLLAQRLNAMASPEHTWSEWRIVGMPMHRWRRSRRGFNQAALLGRRLARILNARYDEPCTRVINTDALEHLSRKQRARTVRGVFDCAPITGNWLIVDDVLTTGASANELASTLRKAGAQRVIVAALARTPINGDNQNNWLGSVFGDIQGAEDEKDNRPLTARRS